MSGIIGEQLLKQLESTSSVIPNYVLLTTWDEMIPTLDPTHGYLLTWTAQTLNSEPGATHYVALFQNDVLVNVQGFGPSSLANDVRTIQAHWDVPEFNGLCSLKVEVATNTGTASFLQRLMLLYDLG